MTKPIVAQNDTLPNGIIIVNSMTLTDSIQQGLVSFNKKSISKNIDTVVKYITPYNKSNNFNNWAIKAKVLPWLSLLPGASGLNYSAGLEFGFLKNHSIGIDIFQNKYSFDAPDVYDSVKQNYDGGPRRRITDRAIFFNYRYYLNFKQIRVKQGLTFYVGSFLRYGQVSYKFDQGYINKTNIVSENHYSIGLMLGILKELYYFKKIQTPLNVDAYFGIYVKEKEQIKEYYDINQNIIRDSDHPVNVGIRLGLTANLTLKRKSTRH